MVSKRLATAVLVTGALHSGIASALGVGDITLESALNQPFRAEIPLRDVGELDVEQIRIALADDTAFENAGVERSQFLSALQFQVELQRGGRGRIIVTTEKAVQEPYLDFIVEVRWPSGKMNREYTVLLDLPVFAPAAAAPSVTVASAPKVIKPVQRLEAEQQVREQGGSIGPASRVAPQVRVAGQQQMLPEAKDSTEYRVQHHDTMWKIAEKLRPSSYVTTQQTMLALLKKNPKAFVGGNVNRIKSGYVLRIPTEAEVHEINHDQAVDEIRDQARVWRGEKVKTSKPAKQEPAANKATIATANAPQLDATDKSGREPVVAQDQAVKFSVGSAGSDTTASNDVDALRQKVREEQENLDKSLLENEAMQTRVAEMEKQIRTLQSLITLKNSQLAALQDGAASGDAALAASQQSADLDAQRDDANAAAASESAEPSSESVITADENAADENMAADKGAAEKAERPALTIAEGEPETKPVSAPEKPDAMVAKAQEWLSNGLVKYIGLGLAVLALLVLIFRRKTAHGDDEADLAAFEASLAAEEATEGDVFAAAPESFDFDIGNTDATELSGEQEPSFNATDFDFDDINVESGGVESSTAGTEDLERDIDLFAADSNEAEAVQPQTGDIVAEADIYVAYGRYDQAASLLKTAINQDPDNADLQVKLADIYLDTRDRDSFVAAYAGLQSLGDTAAIARVKESMSAIDGVSDWLEEEESADLASADDESADDVVDMELDGDFDLGEDLDFELDDEKLIAEDAAAVGSPIESPEATGVGAELGEGAVAGLDTESDRTDLDFEVETDLDVPSVLELGAELGDDGVEGELDEAASLRSAEADALASLDEDLADLDFDFEDDSLSAPAVSEEGKPGVETDADIDVADLSAPLSAAASETLSSSDLMTDAEEELDFDFGDLDSGDLTAESTELLESVADSVELRSLTDDADDELDLDFSSFDSGSADIESTSTDFEKDIAPTEKGEADTENVSSELDVESVAIKNAPDDISADEEFFLGEEDGDGEIEGLDSRESKIAAVDLPSELGLDDLDFELEEKLDPAEHDTDEIDQSELDVDLADFDMPANLVTASPVADSGSSVNDIATENTSETDDDFFTEGDSPDALSPLNAIGEGDAIAVEDLVFDEFDAGEGDENFDNLLDDESVATKLDLARAYVDMGDSEGAKEMLEEVLVEGDAQQQSDAQALLDLIG